MNFLCRGQLDLKLEEKHRIVDAGFDLKMGKMGIYDHFTLFDGAISAGYAIHAGCAFCTHIGLHLFP